MLDVAMAIDAESRKLTHQSRADGSFDADGNAVQGAQTSTPIVGAVLPIKGSELRDLPEGIRSEVKVALWTRAGVETNDQILDGLTTYRVLHVWDRSVEGGFTKAALGKIV